MFRKTFGSDLDQLSSVARELREYLAAEDVSERNLYTVDLALEELLGNTIRYGYTGGTGGSGVLVVEAEVGLEEVSVRFVDDARAFDPTLVEPPPAADNLEEAPIGGLGIKMVRQMIPDMRYARVEARNELTLVLPRGDTDSGPQGRSGPSALPA